MPRTTTKPRPSRATQPAFPRIDAAAERAAAEERTVAQLAELGDPLERFKEAAHIAAHANRAVPKLRAERDRLAVALYVYHRVRAVHEAAGMARNAMTRAKVALLGVNRLPTGPAANVVDFEAAQALARANGIEPVDLDEGLNRLVKIGKRLRALEGAANVAREERDMLAVQLVENGTLSRQEALHIMKVTEGRMSHLLAKVRAA